MNRFTPAFLSIFLLIILSCRTENGKKNEIVQKKEQNISFVINRKIPYAYTDAMAEKFKKNKDFVTLLQSFEKESYSKDALIDLVHQDSKLFKTIAQRRTGSVLDTLAVKSRMTLAHIQLNKLGFLLQKKTAKQDTVQRTFTALVQSINNVINQINLFDAPVDEFKDILLHDSIAQVKRDSLHKIGKDIPVKRLPKSVIKRDLQKLKKSIPVR